MSAYDRVPGVASNLLRVSGEAWFKAAGETAWVSLGDVSMHRVKPQITRKTRKRATRWGFVSVASESIVEASLIFEVELQEHCRGTVEHEVYGATAADLELPARTGHVVTVQGARRGCSFDLEVRRVTAVAVVDADTGTDYELGRDYTLDAELGQIVITPRSFIPDGAELTVTLDCEAVRFSTYSPLVRTTRNGTLRIVEFSKRQLQQAVTPAFEAEWLIPCTLSCDDENERTADDFHKFTLRAVATRAPEYRMRPRPEPSLVRTGEVLAWGSPLRLLGTLQIQTQGALRIG